MPKGTDKVESAPDTAALHLCDDECGDERHPRDGRITPERPEKQVYTFDAYLAVTAQVSGTDFPEARENLRREYRVVEVPDYGGRYTPNVALTSFELRGVQKVFAPSDAPDATVAERFYEGTGFDQLELLREGDSLLPLMFRVVPLSPSGQDMWSADADTLRTAMDMGRVIRVGHRAHICFEDEVCAPKVVLGADDDVRFESGTERRCERHRRLGAGA
ncbi:hypothetical protein OG225_41770 (plasmid) [Nocardia sp. NBC_01377]|uniref:hypothetical protein n=1 Tax=Nocardia sp. NBC_01377 TaxID=2903595 RepID=UPI002F908A11